MPLTEEEWESLKRNVARMFRDVAKGIDTVAVETEALRRLSQGSNVPRDVGVVLEVATETILEDVQRIRRRLTLFGRDIDDLRKARDF